jgi:hypothetical protein
VSNLNCDIEPLPGFGPSDIELIFRGLNDVIWTTVNLVVKLGVGNVDALVHSELVQVRSVRWIENSAAVVPGIEIMVRDAFPAEIVVSTFHPARNLLRPALIATVLIGFSLVMFCEIGLRRTYGGEQGHEG